MSDTSEPEVGDVRFNAELDREVFDGTAWVAIPEQPPLDPREIIRNDPRELIVLDRPEEPRQSADAAGSDG